MRHPPRSLLSADAGAVALVSTSTVLLVGSARGATPADNQEAAAGSWQLAFGFVAGQKVTQGSGSGSTTGPRPVRAGSGTPGTAPLGRP